MQLVCAFVLTFIAFVINYEQNKARDKASAKAAKRDKERESQMQDLRSEQILTGQFDFDFGQQLSDTSFVTIG